MPRKESRSPSSARPGPCEKSHGSWALVLKSAATARSAGGHFRTEQRSPVSGLSTAAHEERGRCMQHRVELGPTRPRCGRSGQKQTGLAALAGPKMRRAASDRVPPPNAAAQGRTCAMHLHGTSATTSTGEAGPSLYRCPGTPGSPPQLVHIFRPRRDPTAPGRRRARVRHSTQLTSAVARPSMTRSSLHRCTVPHHVLLLLLVGTVEKAGSCARRERDGDRPSDRPARASRHHVPAGRPNIDR